MAGATDKANGAKGVLSVWNNYDPAAENFYECWYMTEHFPERLGVPGFLRGRRYKAIEADRQYFTFYELASPEVLFSKAYLACLNAPTAWTQQAMKNWSAMFRTVCERVARAGDAVGGYAIVARFETAATFDATLAEDIRRDLDDVAVVAVDLWRATERQNDSTIESSNRPEPDYTISAAIIVEATSGQALKSLATRLHALLGPISAKPPVIGTYQLIALQSSG